MMLRVYEGDNDVLVFAVDGEGKSIGEEAYFEEGGRDRDDYDMILVEPPLAIMSRLRCEPERVLCPT